MVDRAPDVDCPQMTVWPPVNLYAAASRESSSAARRVASLPSGEVGSPLASMHLILRIQRALPADGIGVPPCLDLCRIACGRVSALWEFGLRPGRGGGPDRRRGGRASEQSMRETIAKASLGSAGRRRRG